MSTKNIPKTGPRKKNESEGSAMSAGDSTNQQYQLTVFDIPKMDCPSEERMIRMALENVHGVKKLSFDLPDRKMRAVHQGISQKLLEVLLPLNLGARITEDRELSEFEEVIELGGSDESQGETRVLRILLGINATMFVAELVLGWIAQSTGLIADSLDMFADAAVYGLGLYAVGKAAHLKKRSAMLTGYLQLALACGALIEVARRAMYGSEPQGTLMMVVAVVALIANIVCLALLTKHRTGGIHMRATYICSSTDVIANFGVIVAGLLVALTGSSIPDLIIGLIIAVVVCGGGLRILRMARSA